MNILNFFKRKPEPPVVKPQPGELWVLSDPSDPFPSRYRPVKILDVKSGWVRYDMGAMYPDERMALGTFLYCYKKVD